MVRSSQSITDTKCVSGNRQKPIKRALFWGVLFRLTVVVLLWATVSGLINPTQAIPKGWNPLAPLQVTEPVTLFTNWRLLRAIENPETCLAALSTVVRFNVMEDLDASDQCHIRARVYLEEVGQAQIEAVETTCAIALRLAMWEQHSLQPAAAMFLETAVIGIDHIGSYNCRKVRMMSGIAKGMSAHATAEAIDIIGFRFADETMINISEDWYTNDIKSQFLHAVRDGACDWFQLTLSPDYNNFHTNYLHLQSQGWGSCL